MRDVQEFGGNLTTELWATMGSQRNPQGVEREGQACYFTIYPNGTPETREKLADVPADLDTLDNNLGEPGGPIDAVAQIVLENFVQCQNFGPEDDVHDYAGLRCGSAWIYGVLLVAKSHGCTQADVMITSNDGNLFVECWDRKLGAYVSGVHNTYYGT